MAYTAKILYTSHLGVGLDNLTGAPSNKKVVVVGLINITSYTSGGEPIDAFDLGLEKIDFIGLDALEQANEYIALWDHVTNDIFLVTTGTTEESGSTDVGEVSFLAVGDSSAIADLL